MRKPALAGAALAVSLIAPLAAAASASAGSEPAPCPAPSRTPVIRSITVSNVVLTGSNSPTAQITVKLSDPDHVTSKTDTTVDWQATAQPTAPGSVGHASFPSTFTRVKNTRDVDTWTARSNAFGLNDAMGRYRAAVSVDVKNAAAGTAYRATSRRAWFFVRGHVQLGRNAGPEPVRQGRTMKVSGQLMKLNSSARHARYDVTQRGDAVQIYFTPGQHGGTKHYMGKAYTNGQGAYTRSFVAKRSGRWYVKFHGGAHYSGQLTRADYVQVR